MSTCTGVLATFVVVGTVLPTGDFCVRCNVGRSTFLKHYHMIHTAASYIGVCSAHPAPSCHREQAGVMESGEISKVQEAESELSSEEEDDACDGPLAA